MPLAARAAVVAFAALLVVNLGLTLLDSATRGADRSGARGSSFSTAVTGTAAYAELLERSGHRTSRARGSLRPGELDPTATVIVLDAGFPSASERRAVLEFARAGGRLVAGGPNASAWAPGRARDVRWERGGRASTRAVVDGNAYRVRTDKSGRWEVDGRRALTATSNGPSAVLLLADTSPLQNQLLDRSDNAAFGIALAGPRDQPVVFVEGPHGFGGETGFDAIPERWQVALVGGALAGLLTLIAASRRLGPPEETVRALSPPRRAYVDALGTSLARTRRPAEAIAPLQAAARGALARRAGLPADAEPDLIRAAADRAGWSADEIEALFARATDRESILAAGRALARAERGAT